MKTLLMVLILLPGLARAVEQPLASTFAACAGRFSAELEHAWLTHDDEAPRHAQRRQQFVDILEATVPAEGLRRTLHMRIDAKMAHARLLSQATFSDDETRATWAVRRAKEHLSYCAQFLLES